MDTQVYLGVVLLLALVTLMAGYPPGAVRGGARSGAGAQGGVNTPCVFVILDR